MSEYKYIHKLDQDIKSESESQVVTEITIETKHGSMKPSPYTLLLAKNIPKLPDKIVVDVGCGSGLLGIIAAKNGSKVLAMDVSDEAVEDTKHNALANGVDGSKITIVKSDMFAKLAELKLTTKVDLILCNPPSLPSNPSKMSKVEYFAGFDGRLFIDRLLSEARHHLKDGGKLIMTHTSLANIAKTFRLAQDLGYSYKILDCMTLKLREFYDREYLVALSKSTNDELCFNLGDEIFESISVVEFEYKIPKQIISKS